MTNARPHDALGQFAQAGAAAGLQLVRLTALDADNRYTARPVEFDANGQTQFAGDATLTVTNLAEPADADGAVPAGTDAVAVDVEGRWIVFVRPAAPAAFAARVIATGSGADYTVREQVGTGAGTFADKEGAPDLTAHNLAELSLGPGAAVDVDTIVLVTALTGTGEPPTVRYVFDHPAYAKYLD